MSDFFSNLYGGIRQPDVVMNGGPLPPSSTSGPGYPAGFNGDPDGRINAASTLLGNVDPYAYGDADRLSTQTAYLNVPHRTQRIIPSLQLPEAQPWSAGGSFFKLSHQVDDGDIAFIIRAMFSPYELVADKKKYNRQGVLFAVDPVVNLATVNYILHGLQRFGYDKSHVSWHTLWQALGIDHYFAKKYPEKLSEKMMQSEKKLSDLGTLSDHAKCREIGLRLCYTSTIRYLRRELVDHLVKNIIRPFGVPTGSEKQGGQHQGSNSAITWPVDFVSTLTIDGLVINLVNFWRHEDVNSGDDLMLYVEDRPYTEYMLSHHPKNVRKQVFPSLRAWEMPAVLARLHEEGNSSTPLGAVALDRMMSSDMFLKFLNDGPVAEDEGYTEPDNASSYADMGGRGGISRPRPSNIDNRGKWMNEQRIFPRRKNYIPAHMEMQCSPNQASVMYTFMHNLFEAKISEDGTDAHRDKLSKLAAFIQGSSSVDVQCLRQHVAVTESVFQLVPGISSSACTGVREAVWRRGYWHIARSQVMHFKYDQHLDIPNGFHAAVQGKVLQATFSPIWAEPLEDSVMGSAGVSTACTMATDLSDNDRIPRKKARFEGPGGCSGDGHGTKHSSVSKDTATPANADEYSGAGGDDIPSGTSWVDAYEKADGLGRGERNPMQVANEVMRRDIRQIVTGRGQLVNLETEVQKIHNAFIGAYKQASLEQIQSVEPPHYVYALQALLDKNSLKSITGDKMKTLPFTAHLVKLMVDCFKKAVDSVENWKKLPDSGLEDAIIRQRSFIFRTVTAPAAILTAARIVLGKSPSSSLEIPGKDGNSSLNSVTDFWRPEEISDAVELRKHLLRSVSFLAIDSSYTDTRHHNDLLAGSLQESDETSSFGPVLLRALFVIQNNNIAVSHRCASIQGEHNNIWLMMGVYTGALCAFNAAKAFTGPHMDGAFMPSLNCMSTIGLQVALDIDTTDEIQSAQTLRTSLVTRTLYCCLNSLLTKQGSDVPKVTSDLRSWYQQSLGNGLTEQTRPIYNFVSSLKIDNTLLDASVNNSNPFARKIEEFVVANCKRADVQSASEMDTPDIPAVTGRSSAKFKKVQAKLI